MIFDKFINKRIQGYIANNVSKALATTDSDELYRMLYELLSTGTPLSKDSRMKDYVREGYEGNPDLFSIVIKLGTMFARLMADVRLMQKKGDKYEEVENKEIDKLFEKTNYYQNFFEFCRHWAVSFYITGNSIVYAPRLPAGLNRNKLTNDGMLMMPTQNVTIFSEGWRNPVSSYTLDIGQQYKISTSDIWHERFAPTLQFEGGQNFMGMSPVKVAMNIINSQNKGYEVTARMYASGHPPGILSKEIEGGDETTAEQEAKFRERYKTKYQGINNMSVPIFTLGKMTYTKIGYDNLQELQVIGMSEHGRRVFCNLLGIPSQLFNDTAASTFNNISEASKAIYTNRLIPDIEQFGRGFNNILRAYGDFFLKPDYSNIEALQEEKAKKVIWISQMFKDGVITGDQYLEMLGEEPTGLAIMQQRYMDMSRVPVDFILNPQEPNIEDSDKFYEKHNLIDKL